MNDEIKLKKLSVSIPYIEEIICEEDINSLEETIESMEATERAAEKFCDEIDEKFPGLKDDPRYIEAGKWVESKTKEFDDMWEATFD